MQTRTMLAVLASLTFSAAAMAADDDPRGRRDPFQPPLENATPLPASDLERYGLGELRVEGIISGIADARATVIVPGGESFVVRTGMRLGTSGGRIARITADEVVVQEESTAADGTVRIRETALPIHR